MANTQNVRFGDVEEDLSAMIMLCKEFAPFKVPKDIKDQILLAGNLVCYGREKDALREMNGAIHGIKLILAAYFRNSPRHFQRLLESLTFLDQDLIDKANKHLNQLQELANSQLEIDFQQAAAVYRQCTEAFSFVQEEMEKRVRNRQQQSQMLQRQEREKRRQKQKDQEAALARQQREADQAAAQARGQRIRDIAMAI